MANIIVLSMVVSIVLSSLLKDSSAEDNQKLIDVNRKNSIEENEKVSQEKSNRKKRGVSFLGRRKFVPIPLLFGK
ncbi:hypothetical protein GWI33_012390 [Rhynchophorus ferrugineus]|uniref:Uncharacterized protein n=1 Tax=Rhynchophorus ferrugineus TaxID=354439 RepID=A0A834M7N5_RHYFE|nr:hypothetical protein GWI33_012390 [Rhynchophorus ferrugineus]